MEWTILNKQKLLQDLKRFGLNPKEWILKTPLMGHKQPQVLSHVEDSEFSLLGIPQKQNHSFSWERIEVLSI